MTLFGMLSEREWGLLLLIGVLGLSLILLTLVLARAWRRLARLEGELQRQGKRRADQSRSVIMGQVTEHLVPLLPGFPYDLKDARFLGQPVDYLVFKGLESGVRQARRGTEDSVQQGTEDLGEGIELVFCEVKTGQSRLSAAEMAVRDAVRAGKVRFEVWRLGPDGRMQAEN